MSQRGPAPQPTSRPPSKSPPRVPFSSQQGPLVRDNVPGQIGQDVAAAASTKSYPPRLSGIRGLINPSESQLEGPAGDPSHPRASNTQTSPYGMPARQYGAPGDRPYGFQAQAQPGSQPATPSGYPVTTPLGHTPTEHNSPKGGFPFPLMSNPRPVLSPGQMRATSGGQASLRGPEPQQTSFLHPTASRAKRPYPGDESPVEPFRSAPGLPFTAPPPLGPTPATMGPLTPTRSASQPMIGHMPPRHAERPQLPPMPRDHPHTRAPEYQGQQHQSNMPSGPSFPSLASSPAGPAWSTPSTGTPLYESLRSDAAKGATEAGMMVKFGGDETGMLVPVDVHHGSKLADEKRQRNAGASARFRQRKKERDQEQLANMQKLEHRNRELETQNRDLTQERDFYRDERNRLRELLLRTPLSDLASGPPSPPSSSSAAPLAETSPLPQSHIPSHQSQQQGYASSESSSAERPTRRRRTDSAPTPEFSVPSFGTPVPQPGSLPPMQAPAYGMMPQRPPSTTPSGERLPPLRAMEGPFGGPGPDASSGPLYPSYTRVPHETGFASRGAGPPPTGGRHGHPGHDSSQR